MAGSGAGNRRLVGLEALRGVAALVVVFGHAASISGTPALAIRMHLAVDLFFVLSGYVMARSYEPRAEAEGYSALAFMRTRLRRIWPTMAIGACLGAVLYCQRHGGQETALLLIMALAFLPVVAPGRMAFPVNVPAWSVMFELVANLAHALALRRLSNRRLGALVAACAATIMALQTVPNPGVNYPGFALGLPRVVAGYGLGVILWRVLRDRAVLPIWLSLAGFPAIIVASHFVAVDALWFDWLFMFAAAPLLVAASLAEPPLPKLFLFLGALSFPLYAVHGPVEEYVRKAHGGGMAALLLAGLASGLAFYAVLRAPALVMRRP